jgi:hypothetical protein
MRTILFLLASILLLSTGCQKADIAPAVPTTTTLAAKSNTGIVQNITIAKTDTVKSVSYSADTDTSNPDYWYNGTKGTAVIKVTCKDCTAIATIGDFTLPFMFNADGIGVLKYTPTPGLLIKIAVCPIGTQLINADIFDASNKAAYSYSGVTHGNWSATYIVK